MYILHTFCTLCVSITVWIIDSVSVSWPISFRQTHAYTNIHMGCASKICMEYSRGRGDRERECVLWCGGGEGGDDSAVVILVHKPRHLCQLMRENSALFHLLSLDPELPSPKTDTVRGTEGEREHENERGRKREEGER